MVDHDEQPVQLDQHSAQPEQVVDHDVQLTLLDHEDQPDQDVQPADQVHDVLAESATQLPPEHPDQGLPRRSRRSVRR